jgi:hypothetical protein
MKPQQNPAEKLLNDYLFATNRHLDQDGDNPDANDLMNFILSPPVKVTAVFSLVSAFACVAAQNMPLATTCVMAAFVFPVTNYVASKLFKNSDRPEFYFDTALSKIRLLVLLEQPLAFPWSVEVCLLQAFHHHNVWHFRPLVSCQA